MRTTRVAIAATAAALLLAGCGSATDGTPRSEDGATTAETGSADPAASDGPIDPDTLDTGGYRTTPVDFVAEGQLAGDFGPAVEGQRMAEFVISPHTVDPQLTDGAGMSTGVGVGGIGKVLPTDGAGSVAESLGVITGFSDFRSTPDDTRELGVAVWRFPDAESAAQAAAGLHRNLLEPGEDEVLASGPQTPVSLPELPDTLASTYRWDTIGVDSMSTFTARGPHVIYTYTSAHDGDTEWVRTTAVQALEQQLPTIDRFPFTPTDEIASLPIDLDKVLARAVGYTEDENTRNSELAIYGPLGWLHFDSHPADTADLFEQTGTDRIALANSTVYRTDSPESAEAVRDAFAEQTLEMSPDLVEEPAPQNIPNTVCLSGDIANGRMTTCTMVYGRYVAQISGHRPVGNADPESDSLRTLSQRVATQYVKFVRAEEAGLGEN